MNDIQNMIIRKKEDRLELVEYDTDNGYSTKKNIPYYVKASLSTHFVTK